MIQIIKVCTLYMITQFYTLCMQLSRGIALYPSFLEIVFCKKIICFLKTRIFKKHHMFSKLNQQSMHILHNQIISYISYTICIRKRLLPLVSKNTNLKFFPFFLNKQSHKIIHDCTFLYVAHTIGKC